MPNLKNADAPTTTAPAEPEFEYVTVPDRDIFDFPHPGVRINRDYWGPGTHKIPVAQAKVVKERLAVFMAQNIRIMQPRKDTRALGDLYKERGAGSVDMTPDNSKQV
jgi:hypothetical protein